MFLFWGDLVFPVSVFHLPALLRDRRCGRGSHCRNTHLEPGLRSQQVGASLDDDDPESHVEQSTLCLPCLCYRGSAPQHNHSSVASKGSRGRAHNANEECRCGAYTLTQSRVQSVFFTTL